MKRVRHFKNQKTYQVLGEALFQISKSHSDFDPSTKPVRYIEDGDKVEVYQSEEEGLLFVRFPDEMNDPARFIPLDDLGERAARLRAIENVLRIPSSGHASAGELAETILDALDQVQPVAEKHTVPISADGKYVFIDGRGDVPILYDCEGELGEAEINELIEQLFNENSVRAGSTFTHGAARAMMKETALRAYRAGRDDGFTKGWNAAPKMDDGIPRLENCGRYIAQDNTGQWHYINHAGTWQGCPNPLTPTIVTNDSPDNDGTDGAHPAWWRGNDHGLHRVSDLVTFWITEPDMDKVMAGTFGEPQLERLRASVIDLRHKAAKANDVLTKTDLRDALDCFWNAALGEAHRRQDSTAFSVASVMAEGIQAIANSLKEGK
ncbi:hypothetical protein J2J97_32315 (plasmid) [Rhizobium bangladeshense]|uniref:hypothetical protein n=1 Tax=Rhizobium bangladeshense TaxID=1138189 RepID=UPI001A980498|nr:hypothetical protein [Rhizobium bangladeshense]QSY98590.1 hypothetical protein J2J97_32315 [Rhizobium bangladeshense]